jgi:hypothetical protein
VSNPKRKPFRSRKLLDSARGEDCTMEIPGVCNHDSETVVFAHSNLSEDGKGIGQKADDCFGAYACSACHTWLDAHKSSREYEIYMFTRALKRTWRRMLDKGVLRVSAPYRR